MTAQTTTQRTAAHRKRAADRKALIEATASFLLDKLEDFENGMTSEEDAREWHGHVAPAIFRFRSAVLDKNQTTAPKTPK